MSAPDALSRAILAGHPELAGQVHYVDGRPWCDGVNHTTRCEPGECPHGDGQHYFVRESDDVRVCQKCGEVKP